MFWDRVAWVYDVFVNMINRKTHRELRHIMGELIQGDDRVLECACGTGLLSAVIAEKCQALTATDYAPRMIQKAKKNCSRFQNITFGHSNILSLDFPDGAFDKVVAGNVIHLLDEPIKALDELNRVCRPGGVLIIPTYMNRDKDGKNNGFSKAVGKAGADFKRQFTVDTYRQFFLDAGYADVQITLAEGRIPCAVAVMTRRL
ncbi:MAG: class I SAM-dependent methyltransferase [Clostridia bacterium]|nr:class I SAM-dependent methyltransferase [Clostridia bacterium]